MHEKANKVAAAAGFSNNPYIPFFVLVRPVSPANGPSRFLNYTTAAPLLSLSVYEACVEGTQPCQAAEATALHRARVLFV